MSDFDGEGRRRVEAVDSLVRQALDELGHLEPLGHGQAGLQESE